MNYLYCKKNLDSDVFVVGSHSNVIATANGSQFSNQLNNNSWLKSISLEINQRIIRFSELAPQFNVF